MNITTADAWLGRLQGQKFGEGGTQVANLRLLNSWPKAHGCGSQLLPVMVLSALGGGGGGCFRRRLVRSIVGR